MNKQNRARMSALEVLFAEDVMSTNVLTIRTGTAMSEVKEMIQAQHDMRKQRLLPVVDLEGIILGAISWQNVLEKALEGNLSGIVDDFMRKDVITTFPEESLRTIADRMSDNHVGVLAVVDREQKGKLRGLITQYELLTARDRILQEERKRERILKMWSFYRYEHSAISSLQHYFHDSKNEGKS